MTYTKEELKNRYSSFIVTGVTSWGKRFKVEYSEPQWAFGINLWKGSIWGVSKETGKRKLLKRAY
jgi:hypothetical protein